MRLRKMLRRMDSEWVHRARRALLSWGYVLPLKNKEVRQILASPEDRREIKKVIKKAMAS